MTMSNGELLQKIDTGTIAAGGALNPEQAKKFFQMVFESTVFNTLHRKEQRTAKQGELDKIAIGGRLLRKKTENTDDNYRAGVSHGKVEYLTIPVRLPWEITEETLRQNIEGEAYEDLAMGMMTKQSGIDLEDLNFNGDLTSADPFLSINDGWVKQITTGTGSHLVSHAALTVAAKFGKHSMFALLNALPNKYKAMPIKWIMAPSRKEKWLEYLTNRLTAGGDAALLGAGDAVNKPLSHEIVTVPSFPADKIILAFPQNFVTVMTYDIRIRKTTEGREAVMQDKRLYVIHFDNDPVIQELDAVAMLYGVPDALGDS